MGPHSFFLEVANQAAPGKSQTSIENIEFGGFGGQSFPNLAGDSFDEAEFRGFERFARSQQALRERGPVAEAFTIKTDVLGGIVNVAEVGQEKAFGTPGGDVVERSVPEFEVDVGRRSSRQEIGFALDADAGSVTDESDAGGGVPVSNVMRSVARRIENVEIDGAEADFLATSEPDEIALGHGQAIAVKRLELIAVETAGTGQQARRVDHVGGAEFMDINFDARIFPDNGTGSAGMVEVNMGEQESVERSEFEAASL